MKVYHSKSTNEAMVENHYVNQRQNQKHQHNIHVKANFTAKRASVDSRDPVVQVGLSERRRSIAP